MIAVGWETLSTDMRKIRRPALHTTPQLVTAPQPLLENDGWRDRTLELDELMPMAWRWMGYMTVGVFVPYLLLWGFPGWPAWDDIGTLLWRGLLYSALAVVIYAISAVVHEGLHALAMMLFAGVPWSSIRFGLRLREGIAYVHTDRPMTVRAYRSVLVVPGLLQGVVPIVVGWLIGSGWLTIYGYVMLTAAVGDIAMLHLMRDLSSNTLVKDHPVKLGCLVKE